MARYPQEFNSDLECDLRSVIIRRDSEELALIGEFELIAVQRGSQR